VILGKPPKMLRDARHAAPAGIPFSLEKVSLHGAAHRVMRHPAVADKTFLVSIGDRTVGGLCARDPCVGPWQVPVADCAVTLLDYDGYAARLSPSASARRSRCSTPRPRVAWPSARRSRTSRRRASPRSAA